MNYTVPYPTQHLLGKAETRGAEYTAYKVFG